MVKSDFINKAIFILAAILILAYSVTDYFTTENNKLHLENASTKRDSLASPFNTTLKTNPPHGKPGHIHELPVGAPLPGAGNLAAMPAGTKSSVRPLPTLGTSLDSIKSVTGNSPAYSGPTNPAHGKPGHRCDLPVGAPLNSTPPNPTTQAAAPVNRAKGVNPAHGQPGHRCDIAVGAPLNSQPSKAPTTTSSSQTTNNSSAAKNVNPAHGQPGHRCDIAVGAPLNSPSPAKADPAKLYPFPTPTDSASKTAN